MHNLTSASPDSPVSTMLKSMTPSAPRLHHADSLSSYNHEGILSPLPMPPSKRPKLSLQTSSLSTTYGGSSTSNGNKPENMATATPTTLNTFNNTFDLTHRPSPTSATASPGVLQARIQSRPSSPFWRNQPYDLALPFGVKPILKNSSLINEYSRGSVASASPRNTRRVFFPAPKKVSFRPILEDEITTYKYTARHIDLSSSEDETGSSDTDHVDRPDEMDLPHKVEPSDTKDVEETVLQTEPHNASSSTSIITRHRDLEALDDASAGGRVGRTMAPSPCRRKRKRRRWEWTLEATEEREIQPELSSAKEGEQPSPKASLGEHDGNEPEMGAPSTAESSQPAAEDLALVEPDVPVEHVVGGIGQEDEAITTGLSDDVVVETRQVDEKTTARPMDDVGMETKPGDEEVVAGLVDDALMPSTQPEDNQNVGGDPAFDTPKLELGYIWF